MASGPTPEALDGDHDHAAGSRPPPPAADDFTSEHASAALDERAHTALANGGSAAQHTVAIFADGSAHGGQRARDGGKPSREEQWRQAQAEEYALEARSLGDERSVHSGGHLALWVLEDGSVRGGGSARNGSVRNGSARGGSARNGSVRNGSVHGGPKGKVSGFGGAVVQVEEPDDAEVFEWGAYFGSLPKKLKGGLDTRLPIPPWRNVAWSWIGSFLGILAVTAMNQWVSPEIDIAFLVGSFGASAVLLFAVLESKMSQPRNFVGGQLLSALVGITTRVVIPEPWIAGPVGMSLALVAMQLTSTTHPPGGATALIACSMATLPKWHGYSFLVTVAVGSVIMQLIALVINNLDPRRRYPTFWW